MNQDLVYIGNFSQALGTLLPVKNLAKTKEESNIVKKLTEKEGLGFYSKCNESLLDLAIRCARTSIHDFHEEIHRIIVCTESHWNTNCFNLEGINRLKEEINCKNAHLMGLSFSFCCNIQLAINTSYSILRGNPKENILVIAVDRCEPIDSRILSGDLTILSDGASGFIVSSNSTLLNRPLKIVDNSLLSDSSIKNFTDEIDYGVISGIQGFVKFMSHCFSLKRQVMSDLECKEIHHFITNNYKKSVSNAFSMLFGFNKKPSNIKHIHKWAHAYSSDIIFTLSEIYDTIDCGQNILTFSSGPQSWGVTLFEKV